MRPFKSRAKPAQLSLRLPTRGGKRRGAGRKSKSPRKLVTHHGRPTLTRPTPVHVTIRMRPEIKGLRNKHSYRVIAAALRAGGNRFGLRVIHHSVQSNHVHLIAEARDTRCLSRGMQGLSIRIAKRLNAHAHRHGKILADRFHVHPLRTPRETRAALQYVLCNSRRHAFQAGATYGRSWLDPYSSACAFDGWNGPVTIQPTGLDPPPSLPPSTWLLRVGWRRGGLLRIDAIPATRRYAGGTPLEPGSARGGGRAPHHHQRIRQAREDGRLRDATSRRAPTIGP